MSAETKQEAQTWWRVSPGRIEAFEVVRVTNKTVIYLHPNLPRPLRAAKKSSWDMWFPTKAQAIEYERERLDAAVRSAEENLSRARRCLNGAMSTAGFWSCRKPA